MVKRAKKAIEEVSARTYYRYLLWFLERHRGHCTEADLEQAVMEYFGSHWTRADKQLINVGQHGTQPKWRNQLAWAKVLAGKRHQLFHTTVGKGKARQTILLAGWLVGLADAAAKRRSGQCMQKKCAGCGAYWPLSAIGCEECGRAFPAPSDKIDLPLDDLVREEKQ